MTIIQVLSPAEAQRHSMDSITRFQEDMRKFWKRGGDK